MSQVLSRRARWLVVGSLAAVLTIASVAVGIAMTGSPDSIVLTLDGNTRQFDFDGTIQNLNYGNNQCSVTPGSLSGPVMSVTASTFSKNGRPVSPAPVGIVDNGMGVNEKGNGNGQDCGRVDYLGGNRSEKLILQLGPAVGGRLIDSVDFDWEAKYNAVVLVDYLVGGPSGTKVGSDRWELTVGGSDSGPDSGNRDNYKKTSTVSADFDTIVITMENGGVSLEGGADWSGAYRTVFHLVAGAPGIDIDVTTNSGDGGNVQVGAGVTWDYVVTNTGNVPLTNVGVTDTNSAGDPVSPTFTGGDTDGDGKLDVTETWTYQASGTASEGSYTNTGSVTATYIGLVGATDDSGYFGAAPAMTLSMSTNGVELEGTKHIAEEGGVSWTYTVTNTGNIALSDVSVSDDLSGEIMCVPDTLGVGEHVDCTKTTAAVAGAQTNNGTASATGPTGAGDPTDATASASYFGVTEGLTFDAVSPDGEVILEGSNFNWVFTVTNTGNTDLTVVIVSEDSTAICGNTWDVDGVTMTSIPPGATATCTSDQQTAGFGEITTDFDVQGQSPLGPVPDEPATSGDVTYYGGLDCGDFSETTGGPFETDDPLAGFVLGPLKVESPCAVAVEISSSNDLEAPDPEDQNQSVFIGPVEGYEDSWAGVTGLLTVVWDVEDPASVGVRPTLQLIGGVLEDVPDCGGDVAVDIEPSPGSSSEDPFGFIYSLIDNPSDPFGVYPNAVPDDGNVCLVRHLHETINYEGTVKTLTTEVFYIYNDPILSRPR